jgi:uncharacterized Ntn-hydrolase superfamily protein
MMSSFDQAIRSPLAHTYSIVARDPETGQLGVAVQSHYFAVGSLVPWAEAGVGAVATQSFVDPAYGKVGLDLMRAGRSAPDALAGMLASDQGSELRQVGIVDRAGRVAAHTGALAIAEAGHLTGDGFTVQANLMDKPTVWDAMAQAYKSTQGELVDRLLNALDAAEAEGGDIRGRQSAALLIVAGENTGRPWTDTMFDLRVDDAPEPLVEIRRLASVAGAYQSRRRVDAALERGDLAAVDREFELAASLAGDNLEMRFWHSIVMLSTGNVEKGIAILRDLSTHSRRWVKIALRLHPPLLPNDPALMERIRKLS